MRVWLIKDAENLPIQADLRRMRIGNLASRLARHGNQVVWWASTFSHFLKEKVVESDYVTFPQDNLELRLLDAGEYARNISLARLRHHSVLAWRLAHEFERVPPPDLIVCCYPIIEVAVVAVRFARKHGIPIVVDIRDMWPDIYLESFPRALRGLGRVLLFPYFLQARYVFSRADALVGISPGLLNWGLDYAGREAGELDKVVFHGCVPLKESKEPPSEQFADLIERLRNKIVFVYSGTFSTGYDLVTVCRAAEKVRDVDEVHFLLIGQGNVYPQVESAARGLSNVTLTGWVGQSDLSHLLRVCDVGLLPWCSIDNAMPNKVFEYFSAGLPIVSSSQGDLEDILERFKVGYSYRHDSADELEGLVRKVASDEALRRGMSQNAASAYADHFHPEVVYQGYEELLERVVERCR